jgi:lipopolysaccharide/colanic/teichoic acid biosynthesis glycosyltransferase
MSFATILTLIDLPFVLIIVLVILLKAEMETIQQQMAEAKKNERTNALKEVKRLCKEFGFTAGMLKGSLAEGRKRE